MCNDVSFKLCTCEKVKLNQSYWTLKRFIDSDWMTLEAGRCFYPDYQDNDKDFIENIEILLNSKNCFDNDFNPENGDILNLNFYQKYGSIFKVEFEFINDKWQHSISISEHLNNHRIVFRGMIEFKNHFSY